jgi:hypothetical protein
MIGISHSLAYLLVSWGAVTAVLVALVIYGNTLSSREEDQLYLNQAEQVMMASEQVLLIGKMRHLARVIVYVAVLSGLLLLASASLWVWIGLNR